MHSSSAPTRARAWPAAAACLVALVLGAWVARQAVDGNGGSFSNNELDVWLVVVGIAFGACLVAGIALVRRSVGRGILLGTVSAALVVGAARVVEVLVNSS